MSRLMLSTALTGVSPARAGKAFVTFLRVTAEVGILMMSTNRFQKRSYLVEDSCDEASLYETCVLPLPYYQNPINVYAVPLAHNYAGEGTGARAYYFYWLMPALM